MTTADDDVDGRRCTATGRLLKGWKEATAVMVAKRRHMPITLDAFMVWFGVVWFICWMLCLLSLPLRCSLFFAKPKGK